MYKIWLNLLGDWRTSLKFWLSICVPMSLLFWYVYVAGYYPSDFKVLQDRGWHQGLFISRMGVVPYLFFSFLVLIPMQEFLFRKLFLDFSLDFFKQDNFWILNILQASIYASLRLLYPYPLGIIMASFAFGLIYGCDYKNNRSLIMIIIFHFLIGVMATTLNLI